MSNSVDNKIVQMRFDNKQFENGVQTSTKSLKDLKKELNFDETIKSLSMLEKAGNSFSIDSMAKGVDALANRFSTLGIIGMTSIQKIADMAITTGKNLIKSLTIDPIMDGYNDYGEKLTSIQTITNATGESIQTVEKYFKELDVYADKTIYNLSDMTASFAKFTNVGISMNKSIPAIKGIANMVAVAGQGAQAAQIAMYNLSQSISYGFLTTSDYKSLNLANVATIEWKNNVIQAALAAGTLKKNSNGLYNIPGVKQAYTDVALFNDALSEGWASSNVLLKVLGDYGDETTAIGKKALAAAQDVKSFGMMMETLRAQVGTGWTDTMELLIGNLDESKKLFTGITNAVGGFLDEISSARNEMLKFWKDNDGRKDLLIGIANVLIGISTILKPIEDAFRDIFPAMTGKRLVEITKAFRSLTENFKIGEGTANLLKQTFKGLFAIADIGIKSFKFLFDVFGLVVKTIFPFTGGLLNLTALIGNFISAVDNTINSTNIFGTMLNKIGIILLTVKNIFNEFISAMSPGFENIKNQAYQFATTVQNTFNIVKKSISDLVTNGTDKLNSSFETVSDTGKNMSTTFQPVIDMFDKIKNVVVSVGTAIKNIFGPSIEYILKKISETSLSDVGKLLAGGGIFMLGKSLKDMFGSFKKIGDSIGGLAKGLNNILDGVTGSLQAMQSKLKAEALLSIAMAIGVLSVSLLLLSSIKAEDMTIGLTALTVIFAELSVGMLLMQKNMTKSVGLSATLMALASSLLLVSFAIKNIGSIDQSALKQGIEGMSAILMTLALFTKVANGSNIRNSTVGMVGLALSMIVLSKAVESFGSLKPEVLEQGMKAVAASLVAIALATKLMPKGASMIAMGIGLNLLGTSLYIMAGAIAILGNISVQTLTTGIAALAASLLLIAVASRVMTGALTGAVSLLAMSVALNMLVPAFVILGSLSLETIGKGVLAIAGIFVVLGLSALVLSPIVPVILALAASVAVLGIGLATISVGLATFTAAWLPFATVFGSSVYALISILPAVAKKIGEGIVAFAMALVNGVPEILKAIQKIAECAQPMAEAGMKILIGFTRGIALNIKEFIMVGNDVIINLVNGLSEKLPYLINAGLTMLSSILDGFALGTPKLAKSAYNLLIDFNNAFAEETRNNLPALIESMLNLGEAIITGLVEGIKGGLQYIVPALDTLGGAIINGFKTLLGINSPSTVFEDFGYYIVQGLINGIKSMISNVGSLMGNVASSIIDTAKNVLGIHSPSQMFEDIGQYIIAGLTGGIKKDENKAVQATSSMGENVAGAGAKAGESAVKSSNEAAKKAFDKAVEWIDDRKYYNQLSLQEELDAWEIIQSQYAEGYDERKKTDREIYRVRKEMLKAEYDNSINWIDDRKYYNQLSLQEELASWERVQSRYLEGSEERKKADREVYKLKNELIKNEEEAQKKAYDHSVNWIEERKYYNELSLSDELDAWERVQLRYKEGSEERKKADREVYRVQKELNDKKIKMDEDYYSKSKEINDKLKQDIKSLNDEYNKAVESRAKSIYDSYGLFDKVGEKEKVSGTQLVNNLQGQLAEITDWQMNLRTLKQKGINKDLLSELTDMGPKSAAQVQALTELSAPELDNYVKLWKMKHKQATDEATKELINLKKETFMKITELNTEAESKLEEYKKTWYTEMLSLTNTTTGQLSNLNSEFVNSINSIKTDTEQQFVSLVDAIQTTMNTPDWTGVGTNIINGITNGIKAASLILMNETSKVVKSSIQVALDTVLVLINSIDDNLSPTIRPVLDLTDVKNGLNTVSGIVTSHGINVSGALNTASSIAGGMTSKVSIPVSTNSNQNGSSPSINNNITGNNFVIREETDIKKVAKELYALQKQSGRAREVAIG